MTALAAAATVAGWVVPKRRASSAGAGRASVWLGITGAVVGFFAIPVVGLPLGGVLGIYVGEHLRTRDGAAAGPPPERPSSVSASPRSSSSRPAWP